MAIMIPNRITADRRATPGERKTFEILAKGLDNSWYVWYDVGIGNKEIYPDFILIHPHYGLLVLEVKDFYFSDLQSISNDRFVTSSRTQINPLRQARNYIFEIINNGNFEKSPPYQYGVVFPNITRNELHLPIDGVSIAEIVPTERILNKFDLRESRFPAALIDMVKENRSPKRMSLSMFNILRQRIDPSLSIPSALISKEIQSDDTPIVLDHIQERIAKGIGEGHRLLRGIAGSGKTLIMLYRAKLLCRLNPGWNILFICWNRSLINYLEQVFKAIKMDVTSPNVQFVYFSGWLREIGISQHLDLPQTGNDKETQNQYEHEYSLAIKRLLDFSPTTTYQAIMIDEGQDFQDDYYRLLLHHLDTSTNSLLICYDLAQNLYNRTTSWKELGISISGRRSLMLGNVNDHLTRNYRNSWEITRFSKFLYNDRIPDKDEEDNFGHVETISGRLTHGPPPFLHLLFDRKEEYDKIVNWTTQLIIEKKLDFSDFLIIYPGKKIRDFDVEFGLLPALSEAGIPYNWISENQYSKSQFSFSENSVKISTVGSAKGMDFEACMVVGADCISVDSPEVILYIAATRARKYLLFTSGGRNHTVKKILESSYENLMALKKVE